MICLFAVIFQYVTCTLSLVSLCLAPVTYIHSNWKLDEDWCTKYGKLFGLFIWYSVIISTRIFVFTMFASYSPIAVFTFVFIHWVLMLTCVVFVDHKLWFAENWSKCQKGAFNVCRAILFEFIYMDFSDDNPSWFSTFFYIIMCIEDAVIITMWSTVSGMRDANREYEYLIYYMSTMFIVDLVSWYWYCWKCYCCR